MRVLLLCIAALFTTVIVSARPGDPSVYRSLLQAYAVPAPAPSAAAKPAAPAPVASPRPAANGVFTFTATSALFYNSTALVFSGVPNVTGWLSYPPKPKTGSFQKAVFFSKALADANGEWAGGSQALLRGSYANKTAGSFLLTLHAPIISRATDLVTVAYKMLPANESALPEVGGVANSALQTVQSASVAPAGSGQQALPATVAPGTTLYNATVVIDVANIAQYTSSATEKFGLIEVQLTPSWGGSYYNG